MQKRRIVAGVVLAAAAVSLVVFLVVQGLDRADKLGSVISALVAVTSIWFVWPKPGGDLVGLLEALELEPLRRDDPRKIGEYTLLGRLGPGSTGVVFLGADRREGRLAVVKVLGADLAGNPVSRERFGREIRSVDDVGKSAGGEFPTVLDANADAEQPWFATEYLPSLPLQQLVSRSNPWRPAAVAWLAGAVAAKLRLIHGKGLVHRDLKPANVLLGVDDVWIIDLGIAKNRENVDITRHGTVGTLAFMSPEQARGTEKITAASDVFSLGALLVYAATGTPPFGNDQESTTHRILTAEPDLSGLAGWDSTLTALIRRCLDKDPAERPSLQEIIDGCAPFAGTAPEWVRERAAERSKALKAAQVREPAVPLWQQARARWTALAAVVALLAFVLVPVFPWGPDGGATAATLPTCEATPDQTLSVGVSADKSELFKEIAAEYGTRSADGHCVQVSVTELNSGAAANTLARGWTESDGPRPDVWSPASSEWLDIARDRATGNANAMAVLPAKTRGAVVTSPVVIAMPKPMAEALGWPRTKEVSWRTLADLATDAQGWGRYQKDWGPFRLGKTNPNYSTSGLNATIGAFHAFRANTDSSGPLKDSDVDDPAAQKFVQDIEQSIVHYGETSLHFLRNLRTAERKGQVLSYISALTVDESSMLAYNAGYPSGALSTEDPREAEPATKLVAMYPKEGTIFHDHPYIELTWPGAPKAKRDVSEDFLRHLLSPKVQKRFGQLGFRAPSHASGELATDDNGVSPAFGVKEMQTPSARTLDKVLTAWSAVRKPANVLFVVDTSGSMKAGVTANEVEKQSCEPELMKRDPATQYCPSKIELIKKYRGEIVNGFTDSDRLGLWNFSTAGAAGTGPGCRGDHCELLAAGPLSEVKRQEIADKIRALPAEGGTGLFDTVDQAVTTMRQNLDRKAINAVVLLTDGRNDKSTGLNLDQLLDRIKITADAEPVRVFTIAYGFASDEDARGRDELRKIAEATAAGAYEAKDPGTIADDLVAAITSNF
ncbi:protein kinase domain-containing protein [Lentzea aerocolonigenes]|uniref:protein kinase domain-containing protein n=1 Tax=Lentzea aerocolonigenes TaxID=68170 RepID=UPI0006976D30|nr:extracellular solute-binding protein [Lentzea aerocolonigenes]